MDVITITKKALVFDKEELDKLESCLSYCYLRANQHDTLVVKELSFIEYMRKKIREI